MGFQGDGSIANDDYVKVTQLMSPYLFIIVADVLQQLIGQNNAIRHPIYPILPCATI